jgi:hypothetical protein
VTCHVEHRAEVTFTMGVTQPPDFCIHCHADIGRDRPTHTGLGFETCQAAGCHNYHDNRALHVDYLEAQLEETGAMADRRVPALRRLEPKNPAVASHDAPAHVHAGEALPQWAASAHARGGVNCRDCHDRDSEGALAGRWQDVPPRGACSACHAAQVGGFEAGKHGMRLARGMQPMRPADARLPMRSEAYDRELDCQSCHGAHAYDRGAAAVDACLGCHDDAHSRAYRASPHYASFRAEQEGRAPEGSGVSCATCHMPRVEHPETGEPMVQHNQNDNLRPSEKMVRPVCGRCHAVAFVLDALADRALVARNFAGRPALHVESMDMLRAKLGKLTSTAPRNPRSKPEETPCSLLRLPAVSSHSHCWSPVGAGPKQRPLRRPPSARACRRRRSPTCCTR